MIFEPLAGRRETLVTQTQTAIDFAHALKYAWDVMYPFVDRIVLVTDNLNTHKPGALYEAFCAEEAHRLVNRFEWHICLCMGVGWVWLRLRLGLCVVRCLGLQLEMWGVLERRLRLDAAA